MAAGMSRERLAELLRLAQAYRGWSRKELSEALGRDPTRLVPASGNPKLDLVLDLAEAMDWSVDAVAAYLADERPVTPTPAPASFESSIERSTRLLGEGRYRDAIAAAQEACAVAPDADACARACVREAAGWDGLGRYAKAMEVTKRALGAEGLPRRRRLILKSNLAIEYYTLQQLVEAGAIAECLLNDFQRCPPDDPALVATRGYAHYVTGHCHRRMISTDSSSTETHARSAIEHLTAATHDLETAARTVNYVMHTGAANTCRGGIIEAQVATGQLNAGEAIETICETIESRTAIDDVVGDELESLGWWCIFGCNIILRHFKDPKETNRRMSFFTERADRIAVRLDNWALRERVFVLDFERRRRFADWTGWDPPLAIAPDELQSLAGTMARFPSFRTLGRHIIQTARIETKN